MKNKPDYGMSIRLPSDMILKLKEIRKKEEFPSMATALKFWLEQQAMERTDSRLFKLEENIKELSTMLHTATAMLIKTNWKINILANPDELENREGEELEASEVLKKIDSISPKEVWERVLGKK